MKILFVCSGNICRSPMAEAIFRELCKGRHWIVRSAGTHAMEGLPMTPNAKKALKKRGVSAPKRHVSTQFSAQMNDEFDWIICMTDGHKSFVESFTEPKNLEVLDVCDPFLSPLEIYLQTCEELEDKLKELYEKISNSV